MSSYRCLKLLTAVGICSFAAACVHVERSESQRDQAIVAKSPGACRGADFVVADGTVMSKCAIPGQGVNDCSRYICQRCNNGTWGEQYPCSPK